MTFAWEEDYDHEYHFAGRPYLPLASDRQQRHVIYIGSLSKSLGSTFRCSFIVPPAEVTVALERQPDHPMALASLMFFAVSQNDEAAALRRWPQVRRAKTPPEVVEGLRQVFAQQFGRTLP